MTPCVRDNFTQGVSFCRPRGMSINFRYPPFVSAQNNSSMTNCVIPTEETMKPLMMHEMEICFLVALLEHFDLTQVTTEFLNGGLEAQLKGC